MSREESSYHRRRRLSAVLVPGACIECGGTIEPVMRGTRDEYRCLRCFADDLQRHDGRSRAVRTDLPPQPPGIEQLYRLANQQRRRTQLREKRLQRSKK